MAWLGVLAALAPVAVVLVRKWRRAYQKQATQMTVKHYVAFILEF